MNVVEVLPDPVIVCADHVVAEANAAARTMLAFGSELVGRHMQDLLAPGELERFEYLDHHRSAGWSLPWTCRLRFVRTDGSLVSGDVRWARLPDGRVVLSIRDVTEATRAEDLMSRLARLPSDLQGAEALLDAAEPILCDLGWTAAFTEIVEGGSVTRRILAAETDPIGNYGRTIVGRFMPRDATPVLDEVLRRGEAIFLDDLPTLQKGSVARARALSESMERARIMRSAWCPVRPRATVTHLLAVTGRDITEHDFVAIQLFAAQIGAALRLSALRREMVGRERLAAVGEMAAVLAHEVRNPLAVMSNALTMLDKTNAVASSRQLHEILRQEAGRLTRLVSDLLEFSRASAPALGSVPLRPIVEGALVAARHDESFAASAPVIDLDVDVDVRAHTDAVLLRRALLNLIVNAFQHVTPKGRVSISARQRSRHEVALVVANEGPAIDEAVAKRVFEPFFTTKPTGTGLGLAIVHRIAVDIGARVGLTRHDHGPAFELVLPAGGMSSRPDV